MPFSHRPLPRQLRSEHLSLLVRMQTGPAARTRQTARPCLRSPSRNAHAPLSADRPASTRARQLGVQDRTVIADVNRHYADCRRNPCTAGFGISHPARWFLPGKVGELENCHNCA